MTQTITDHALWDMTSGGVNGFYTQSVMFLSRPGTCCNNGWHQSSLSVSERANVKQLTISVAHILCMLFL